jgi:hypothetical protein
MSVAVGSKQEAHFLCGFLSASPIRWMVRARSSGRQISASVIDAIGIPVFDPLNEHHRRIAEVCERGHRARQREPGAPLDDLLDEIDESFSNLVGWEAARVRQFSDRRPRAGQPPRVRLDDL